MTDWLVTVPLGAVLGFLIGLTGVGGGALVAPSLYVILGLLMLGSLIGTVLGAKTALRLPGWALKLIIVVLILAGAVATVAKAGQIAR